MSVLSKYFDKSVGQCSPVQLDYKRTVSYDAEGNEIVMYTEVDYPTFQASLGVVKDWSLDALLKAGVNPNFSIHTGNPTRLEGLDSLDSFMSQADEILEDFDIPANDE